MHDELYDAEDSTSRIDIKEVLLYGLARSRGWVLVLVGIGTALGLIYAASKPNTYTSRAKLLLRIGDREQMTSEAMVGAGDVRRESQPTMQDELHLLSDVEIFRRVAREMGPELILHPPDPSARDDKDTPWPVRSLHKLQKWLLGEGALADGGTDEELLTLATKVLINDTVVIPERDSNVISVYHTAGSPERAREVADSLVRAFVERHRDQFSIERLLAPSRERLDDAKNGFEQARSAYFDHVELCGFVDMDTQGPALLGEIEDLETQLFAARVRREEVAGELGVLRTRLGKTPAELEQVTRAVYGDNEEYESQLQLQRDLQESKGRLAFANLSREEQRRLSEQYDTEIAEVGARLKLLPRRVVVEPELVEHVPNPDHVELVKKISLLEVEDLSLGTRISKLEDRGVAKQERLAQLRQCESIHEYLIGVSSEQEDEFQELNHRFRKLEALGAVDIESEGNLQVLLPPTYDEEKDGPKRAKTVIMGLLAGLFAGILVAATRQLLDPHLRYPGAAERALGVRTLAVIPEIPILRRLDRETRRRVA